MAVVLDTNVVGVESPLGSNPVRVLLDAAARGRLQLVIPELVVLEVVNKWRERVTEQWEKLTSAQAELARYGVTPEVPPLDIDRAATGLDRRLRRTLGEHLVAVPDLPRLPHADLVKRALARQQPFDAKGKDGYRDALLWESVLKVAASGPDVTLISRDARAFAADRSKGGALAPLLAEEAQRRTGRSASVRLSEDPRTVSEPITLEDSDALQDAQKLLEEDSFRLLLADEMEEAVMFFPLAGRAISALELGVPVDDAYIYHFAGAERVEASGAYRLAEGDTLIDLEASVAADVVLYIEREDAQKVLQANAPVRVTDESLRATTELLDIYAVGLFQMRFDAVVEMPAGRPTSLAPIEATLHAWNSSVSKYKRLR